MPKSTVHRIRILIQQESAMCRSLISEIREAIENIFNQRQQKNLLKMSKVSVMLYTWVYYLLIGIENPLFYLVHIFVSKRISSCVLVTRSVINPCFNNISSIKHVTLCFFLKEASGNLLKFQAPAHHKNWLNDNFEWPLNVSTCNLHILNLDLQFE